MAKLKMYWWNRQPNFGDALNPIILERLFGVQAIWTELRQATLIGIGSVLHLLARETRTDAFATHKIHVWGSGYIYNEEPPVEHSQVVYHAVRGKQTQIYGHIGSHVALGDPAVLSPFLIEGAISKRHAIGIVPHYIHQNEAEILKVKCRPEIRIIDVANDPLTVIRQIASCEFVFSSSLHGLVVADSLKIPNQWVGFRNTTMGNRWKFQDYYSGFPHPDFHAPQQMPFNASLMSPKVIRRLMERYIVRPGITGMQDRLAQAFPF